MTTTLTDPTAVVLSALAEPIAAAVARELARELRPMLRELVASSTPHEPSNRLPRTAFTVREVAESWGVPYIRVLELVQTGRLRAVRTGQRYLVPRTAIDDYLAAAS